MPTPVAHALGGVAAGCLVVAAAARAPGTPGLRRGIEAVAARLGPWRCAAGLAALGVLPDVDLLLGAHRGPTHSLGAVLLVGAAAGAAVPAARLTAALTAAAVVASHPLLDWLGTDTSPPQGIMAWWPWTDHFYRSDAGLFMRVCRQYASAECWRHNALAVVRELALLAPLTLGALLAARRALRGSGSATGGPGR